MDSRLQRLTFRLEFSALVLLAALALAHLDACGAFSRHMMVHIALMTLAAPVLALLFIQSSRFTKSNGMSMLLAAALQVLMFSLWHLPPGMRLSMASLTGALFMQAALLLSAVWFWYAVFTQEKERTWPAVIALLLTGKIFCLVGIILTFAPRVLYGPAAGVMAVELADQHLAGLLMVTLCPLTYLAAAIFLIAHWLHGLSSGKSLTFFKTAPESFSWPGL